MAYSSKGWMPERHVLYDFPKQSMDLIRVNFYEFTIGDVEDPYLYVAKPLSEWKETERGKWCMEHCEGEIILYSMHSNLGFGYKILIQGNLSRKNLTYYNLKWGNLAPQMVFK